VIRIEDLRFQYGGSGFVLRVDRLTIARGERVAVVGPSGSGKTTLLYLLAGVCTAQHGRVVVDGTDLARLSDATRRDFRIGSIGLVFQDFELIDYLNVRDNILLPYYINGSLRLDSAVRMAAEALAAAMGLDDKLRRPIDQLSQGERQRVAICRALLPGPKLLLADEPTGNLDPPNKRRILQLLMEQAESTAATLLMVTHDHSLLNAFERVIDLADFQQFTEEG
jgi:putative ABC transport system ATP-binding protein